MISTSSKGAIINTLTLRSPQNYLLTFLQILLFTEIFKVFTLTNAQSNCTAQVWKNVRYNCHDKKNILGSYSLANNINDYISACTNFAHSIDGAKGWIYSKNKHTCLALPCAPILTKHKFHSLYQQSNFNSGKLNPNCFTSTTNSPSTISPQKSPTSQTNSKEGNYGELQNNLLLIVVDDLGQHFMPPDILPGSDIYPLYQKLIKILKDFVVFTEAHTQVSVCGPSRASFLTGRRPDKTGVYDFNTEFREKNPKLKSILGMFKNAGYDVQLRGKIFHDAQPNELYPDELSVMPALLDQDNNECKRNKMFCALPVTSMRDYQTTTQIINILQEHAANNVRQPFFYALGLLRGHYPHAAPNNVLKQIPLGELPNMIPELNSSQFLELWNMDNYRPNLPLDFNPQMFDSPNNNYLSLGYYAGDKLGDSLVQVNGKWIKLSAISYGPHPVMNAYTNLNLAQNMVRYQKAAAIGAVNQIVRLLQYILNSQYANNTIIAILSDHGLSKFPANNEISKNTLLEAITRVVMMFKVPGVQGGLNTNPVELVSVLKTLCELTNVNCTDGATNELPLDGTSLVPGLINPNIAPQPFAISQYERCNPIGQVQSNTCMNALTTNGPKQKPTPKITQMTYKITEKINGIIYQYACSFAFQRAYSFYGPTPTSIDAPGMQYYNPGLITWRIDFNNTGVISTKEPIELFMYARTPNTPLKRGENLLFSITPENEAIRQRLLAHIRSVVDPNTLAIRNKLRL